MEKKQKLLAQLPQVDKLLQQHQIKNLLEIYPRDLLIDVIRDEIEDWRQRILNSRQDQDVLVKQITEHEIINSIEEEIKFRLRPKVQRCVNATGIILHTGLGRAPLSKQAQQALMEVSDGFSTIEIELESGKRGDRHRLVEDLLIKLTGAEAAAVVNNNAAATLLTLNTLSLGKECVVSRGELITIGGSFRIPDIMQKSGAIMREIGTTNQTWLRDYEQAINENTALLLKVHTSNYRISGFVEDVSLSELVALGNKHHLPVMHDLGSGSLLDLSRFGLPKEPVVRESIDTGADVVTFSGDKLLGGPQSGIIVGKKKYLDLIKKNQLARPLRCGKLTFAALEATLKLFLDERRILEYHPVLQLLTQPIAIIEKKASDLKEKLIQLIGETGTVGIESGESAIGGGSLATESLPTKLVYLSLIRMSEDELAKAFRLNSPPIITRISNHRVVFDIRTVRENAIEIIIEAVGNIIKKIGNRKATYTE